MVTSIGGGAFYECSSLTSITIPNSVTKIETGAFGRCVNLGSVNFSGTLDQWCNINFMWPSGGSNPMLYAKHLYINGVELKGEVIIPEGITELQGTFIGCTEITRVVLPSTLTRLGDWVFGYCTGLTSITIPKTVTMLNFGVFGGCSSLLTINYEGTQSEWEAITKEYKWNVLESREVVFSDGTKISTKGFSVGAC